MIKSGKSYKRNLLLLAAIASLSTTMIMQTPVKAETLYDVINSTTGSAVRSYYVNQDENISGSLGTLGIPAGSDTSQVTLVGDAIHSIIGTGATGVSIPNGGTLIVNNIKEITGFYTKEQAGGFANVAAGGKITITNTSFKNNSDNFTPPEQSVSVGIAQGAALYNAGKAEITGGSFISNTVSSSAEAGAAYGGAIYNTGNFDIDDTLFSGNTATSHRPFGGAIYSNNSSENKSTIQNATFKNNHALMYSSYRNEGGGAIYNNDGTIEITGSTFGGSEENEFNSSSNDGGAIYNNTNGKIVLNSSNFINNQSYYKGNAIYNKGELVVEDDNTFKGGSLEYTGNLIYSDTGSTLKIGKDSNSLNTFSDSTYSSGNGMIRSLGALNLNGTLSFKDNNQDRLMYINGTQTGYGLSSNGVNNQLSGLNIKDNIVSRAVYLEINNSTPKISLKDNSFKNNSQNSALVGTNVPSNNYGLIYVYGNGEVDVDASNTFEGNKNIYLITNVNGTVNLSKGFDINNSTNAETSNDAFILSSDTNGVINLTTDNETGKSLVAKNFNIKGYGAALTLTGGTVNTDGIANTIKNAVFENNTASRAQYNNYYYGGEGGAVYLKDINNLTFDNVTFKNNIANSGYGGALAAYSSNVSINNSTFEGNKTNNRYGSAIYYHGGSSNDLSIKDTTFKENSIIANNSYDFGHAVYADGYKKLDVSGETSFINNTVGAIYAQGFDEISITGDDESHKIQITGNTNASGNILGLSTDKLTINHVNMQGNSAGAGLYYYNHENSSNENTINDVIIKDNTFTGTNTYGINADFSSNNGELTISNSTIEGNTFGGTANGSAPIRMQGNANSKLTLNNVTIQNNIWDLTKEGYKTSAGAVSAPNATLVINNSIIKDNTTTGSGAINSSSGTKNVEITDTSITRNTASNYGGGIYTYYPNIFVTAENSNVSISGNTAKDGGAIYSDGGSATLYAKGKNLTVENNTATSASGVGIYVKNSLDLKADSTNVLKISDSIKLNSPTSGLNINTDNNTGIVDLSGAITNSGAANIYGGTLKLSGNALTNKFNTFNVKGNSTIDLSNNGSAADNMKIGTLASGDKTLTLNVDYNGTANTNNYGSMDKLTVDTVSETATINLNNINISTDGEATKALFLDGDGASNVTILNSEVAKEIASSGGYTYTFAHDTTTKGLLNISRVEHQYDLPALIAGEVIGIDQYAITTDGYKPFQIPKEGTADEYYTSLGTLTGANREFTISGGTATSMHSIDGTTMEDAKGDGVTVGSGQTLNLRNISQFKNFTTAVDNAGTLNVENVTFTGNTTADINNTNELNLSGTNTIKTITGATGNTYITGGMTTISSGGSVTQNAINMQGGGLEVRDGATVNKVVADEDYSISSGRVIYNNKGKITEITGVFSGNESTNDAVAIYNSDGTIGTIVDNEFVGLAIDADFINNTSKNYGGAIRNYKYNGSGKIGNIKGDFVGNTVTGSGDYSGGGAIHNNGIIGDITARTELGFKGNTVQNASYEADGGAIYNQGTIGNISANFTENEVSGYKKAGAAIYNYSKSSGKATIGNITGNFTGNKGSAAIYNLVEKNTYNQNKAVIGNISGDFESNTGTAIVNEGNKNDGNYIYAEIGDITGTFASNHAAIYNKYGKIGDVTADFISNNSGSVDNTLENTQNSEIKSITAKTEAGFSYNNYSDTISSYSKRAALGNAGTIGEITSNFKYNIGGAISNSGQLGNITGDFLNNEGGNEIGAIYNNGIIGTQNNSGEFTGIAIKGDFKNNTAHYSDQAYVAGAAIHNDNAGLIGDIQGNFENNKGVDARDGARGGAIANMVRPYATEEYTPTIGNIVGNFKNNSLNFYHSDLLNKDISEESFGGAVYNGANAVIGDITGDFESNWVRGQIQDNTHKTQVIDAAGGAIFNEGTIGTITGDFKNNYARRDGSANNSRGAYGGAIYTTKSLNLVDSNITGNYVVSGTEKDSPDLKGGAIYTTDGINITANTKDISVSGNYGTEQGAAIYNTSSDKAVVLNATGGNITFENNNLTGLANGSGVGIYSTGGLTVNSASNKYVSLNDALNIAGNTTLNGTLKLGDNAVETLANTTSKFIATGGTLDIANGAVDNMAFTNAVDIQNAINLGLDVNLTGTTATADKITADITSGNTSAITLSALNFINDNYTGSEEDHNLTIADGTIKSLINQNITSTTGNTNTYTYSYDQNTGILTVSLVTYDNIYDAVHDTEKATRTYKIKLAEGETVTQALGALAGTSLTVNGNNKYLDGTVDSAKVGGFIVADGQELTLKDISQMRNFTTAVDNAGTLNVENVSFYSNTTDINNTGTVNLTGNNATKHIKNIHNTGTLNHNSGRTDFVYVTGDTGIINVNGGTLYLEYDGATQNEGSVTQDTVNLRGGTLSVLVATLNSDIVADGTVESTGRLYISEVGTLNGTISGTFKNSGNAIEFHCIDTEHDDLTLNGVNFDSNSGAIVFDGAGDLTLINNQFTNNEKLVTTMITPLDSGAGVNFSSTGTNSVTGATFKGNKAYSDIEVVAGNTLGGAIYQTAGTLTIANSTFGGTEDGEGNAATTVKDNAQGGAIYYSGANSNTITNTTFTGNSAITTNGNAQGGAIYQENGTYSITGTKSGTGDNVTSTTMFINNVADGNDGSEGGAIYIKNTSGTIDGVVFKSNEAVNGQGGGAIALESGGTHSIKNTAFLNNVADVGAAIYNNETTSLTIENSVFTGNNSSYKEGAIFSNAANQTLTIKDSIFTDNDGGAIYAQYGGTITVQDTSITATANHNSGSAIYLEQMFNKDMSASIIAKTANVEISGYKDYGIAAYKDFVAPNLTLYAQGGNILIKNNTQGGINNVGGILTMNADSGHNVTINDAVSSTTGMTVNDGGTHLGTVALNGNLENAGAISVGGGTLELGSTAVTSLANAIETNDGTVKLTGGTLTQNIAGATTISGTVINNNATLGNVTITNTGNFTDNGGAFTTADNAGTLNLNGVTLGSGTSINNTATLNLSGTNTIKTITGATGTTNIKGGTTTFGSGSSITQSAINMQGGRLIVNGSANTDIIGDANAAPVTTTTSDRYGFIYGGVLDYSGSDLKSISGAFNGNSANSTYEGDNPVDVQGGALFISGGITSGIDAIFTDNQATSVQGEAKGGALYILAGAPSVAGTYTNNKAISTNNDAKGGAIYNRSSVASGITGAFTSNSAISNSSKTYSNAYGGAIYTDGKTYPSSDIIDATFTSNSATAASGYALGGAVYTQGGTISGSTFTGNTVTAATASKAKGSAVYIDGNYNINTDTLSEHNVIGSTFSENGAGGVLYASSGHTTIKNSNFTNNLGDAIVFSADDQMDLDDLSQWYYYPVKGDIIAEAANVAITGNSGWGIVGNNNHETTSALTLYAKSGNITISGNTTGGINNNGLALTLNADTGYNVTIADAISSTTGMTVNDGGTHLGTVALNGDLENAGSISVGGGTLELGEDAVTSLANAITTNNGTVELTGGTLTQNIAGATTISGTVINNNATLGNVTITNTGNFTDNGGAFTTADNAGTFTINGVTLTADGTSIKNTNVLNLTGSNTIKTITDAATPTGVTNITGGATWIKGGSVTQNTINLKGGDLVLDLSTSLPLTPGTITANIVGDETVEKTGIILNNGTISGTISGTFKGNNNTALANYGTVGNITADFVNNTATVLSSNAKGGAIYNEGGTLGTISGNFTGNSATSSSGNAYGGAIYQNGGTLTISDSTFGGSEEGQGNSANSTNGYAYGGAIYLTNATATITDSNFEKNSAMWGGAIYQNSGSLTLNNATFKNNTGNIGSSIYQKSGTLSIVDSTFDNTNSGNLWQESGNLSITGSNFTNTSLTSRLGSNVMISGTTFDNSPVHFLGKGNETSASNQNTFSIVNSTIQNVTASHSNAYALSVCGGDVTIDGVNIINNTNARGIKSEAGAQSAGDYTHYSKLNIIAQTADVNITGNKEGIYVVGWNNDDHYHTTLSLYAKNHDILISGNTDRGLSYYDQYGSLTLNADTGHNITINDSVSSNVGMTVNAGGTHLGTVALNGNLENAGAISVGGGTLELGSTAVTSLANAIETNDGTVKLTGGTLTQAIAGNTTVSGSDVTLGTNGSLVNATVANGAKLTSQASQFTTMNNLGTLLLSGTLDKAISGTGETKINQTLTFAEGENPAKASIAGTLNMNSGTLNMVEEETPAYTNYTVGTLKGSGNLAIDFNGTNTDKLTITTADETPITVTLTALNGLTTDVEMDSALTILQGASNVTLAVSQALRDTYDSTTHTDKYDRDIIVSDAVWTDTFKDRYYDEVVGKQLALDNTTANKKLMYTTTTTKNYDPTKDISLGDTLALVNQKEDTTRTFTTDSATATYNVGSALGDTGAGKITVQGAKSGDDISTLNMAGNTGFVIGTGAEVELNTVKVTNTANSEGSLINNTAGTATLNNVEIASNSANVISSSGTLGVTDSTVNAGVNNNGTINLNGTNQIASVEGSNGTANVQTGATTVGSIFQKLINIVSGGKLASNGDVTATNGITNDTTNGLSVANGTLTGNVTGDGSTAVKGAVQITSGSTVSQQINITGDNSSLTANADSIGGAVNNAVANGLVLTGGTLAQAVTGDGSTKILAGSNVVENANGNTISQTVNVASGTLKIQAADILNNITSNTGTVELKETSNLSKSISGNTTVSGTVVNNGSLENANITGTLTTSADKVTGTITNAGTLNLSGTLDKAISGAGETVASSDLTLRNGASVAGILNTNGNAIIMSGDNAATQYNVGTLTGTGTLSVDVINNGGTIVSDSINATTYTDGLSLQINNITGLDTVIDSLVLSTTTGESVGFNLNVLNGYTGDGLTVASSVTSPYTGFENVYRSQTDELTSTANWTDKFGESTWQDIYNQVWDTSNGNISYTVTKTGETEHIYAAGDTLQMLNTASQFGTTERKFVTTDSNALYNVTTDMGITSEGTMTVKGSTDGVNTSTIDFITQGEVFRGFVVKENTVLNLDTVIVLNPRAEDGALINNISGIVNLNNFEVESSRNVISNNSTINLTGSNEINSGITGTGTTNVKSGTSIIDRITQKVVEIFTGSKLETEKVTASEQVKNAGDLAITGDANTSNITGAGTTEFTNNVNNTGDISQGTVKVADGKTLTTSGDITTDNITNGGTVTLNSADTTLTIKGGTAETPTTVAGTINGTGTTVISGNSQNNGTIATAVQVAGSLTTSASSVTGGVENNNALVLTDGNLASVITGSGNTTINGAVTNTGNNSIGTTVSVNDGASLSTVASAIGNSVTNSGTVTLTGGELSNTISGSGHTDIEGNVTASSVISQNINVNSGKLTSSADNLQGTVTNDANVEITGGTISHNITSGEGAGTTSITGDTTIASNAAVSQAISVATDTTLTANANSIGGAVTNSGEVALTGGTLSNAITGGNITVSGNTSTNADNLGGAVANSANLNITGGTIAQNITGATGTTTISGDTSIADGKTVSQAIAVATDTTLTANANSIGGAVTSSGTVDLTGGTLSNAITGGNITVSGNTSTNADNLGGAVTNASSNLELTGGTLSQNVSGNGTTKVAGDVTNNAVISNNTNITSGSLDNTNGQLSNVTVGAGTSVTSSADNISGTVANSGDYNVTGGTISNAITGSGNTNLQGDTTVAAAVSGVINVGEGNTLNVDTTATTVATAIGGATSVNLSDGSTLDISGNPAGAGDAVNNISVATGNTANLAMDWGDSVSTNNIAGNLSVSDIDLTATSATAPASYNMATGSNLANVAISENVNLKTTDTSFNQVKYNSTSGAFAGARSNLVQAVNTTEAGDTAIYSMSGDEPAGASGAGTLDAGKLIVQGNGNTINGYGIIVGDGSATKADLTIKDASMKNISGDALVVNGNDVVTLVAENSDIEISGTTGNAITLNKDSNGNSTVNIEGGSHTVTIENDIISDDSGNTVKFNSGTVNFNGTFDPAQAVVGGATVNRDGDDDGIDWTVTLGTLNYLQDSYLNRTTNTMNLNGGTLNTINGVVTDFNLGSFTLSNDSNFYADVDLAAGKMDNFSSTPTTYTGGTLHVAGLNLLTDATSVNTSIPFANSTLAGHVDYTGAQGLTALSPIYKYNVGYDNTTGNFDFTRFNTGGYGDFNPSILAAPVAAQLGGYFTQLQSYEEAFRNMDMYMLMTKKDRQAMKLRNKYAASDGSLIFDPTVNQYENSAGWFRPYATFERVGLNYGPNVANNMYGSFFGGESKMYDLGHGWDGMWGVYIGYNGSHQTYDNVGIYQNGGTLGLVGMAYKGNFFQGLTVNVGANGVQANTMYGSEDFGMLMTGVASKTGYNIELKEGKFIIQPNLLMSYSFVNTFNYTNGAGIDIQSDPLHAIQIEPGVKLVWNLKNGWQPYAGVSMVWNIMDKTHFTANDVSLPDLSVKPFVKYGIGVRKSWGERFTGFLQAFITNGGRNGIGFQAGFRWMLGKSGKAIDRKSAPIPEIKKAEIKLHGKKVQ